MEMQTSSNTELGESLENLATCHFLPLLCPSDGLGGLLGTRPANSDLHYLLTVPADYS